MAYKTWKKFPIVIAANRDEFFNRPARKAEFWTEYPEILAGKDLSSNGTWLGVTKNGRISFVTNKRDFREPKITSPISRGRLVLDFLRGEDSPYSYQKQLLPKLDRYEGFNLFIADMNGAFCLSNRGNGLVEVSEGFHTLSNAFWNTPWPKTLKVLERFKELAQDAEISDDTVPVESIFDMLNDTKLAENIALPDTGIGLERERLLSSIRISLPGYGTRVSTILAISDSGICYFYEKTFQDPFVKLGEVVGYEFGLEIG